MVSKQALNQCDDKIYTNRKEFSTMCLIALVEWIHFDETTPMTRQKVFAHSQQKWTRSRNGYATTKKAYSRRLTIFRRAT